MALFEAAAKLAALFEYPTSELNKTVVEFHKQMDEGLERDGTNMPQIPTYVTGVPNGTEKGLYMAVDLGGTNFRVCSIQLLGDSTFTLTQSKVPIPRELMVAKTSQELFSFLAKQIENFLKTHHTEQYKSHIERRGSVQEGFHDERIFSLGFTFSFPTHQMGINRGTLLRWTKGFDIPDAVGKDVCHLLQQEIDALDLPVKVVALVNDTTGTLLARSYTSPGKSRTMLGAIFGTGTNGAYVEKMSRIKKLPSQVKEQYGGEDGEMVINSEWGSFDNTMHILPNTKYDEVVNAGSTNPGVHMFEKRVSGMFLGEILRLCILELLENPDVPLFSDTSSAKNDLHSTTNIAESSPLYKKWGLDTAFLSTAHGDQSAGLRLTRQALDKEYGVNAASEEDAIAVQLVARAIGLRAARLAALAIGSVVIRSGKLDSTTQAPIANTQIDGAGPSTLSALDTTINEEDIVDIGLDGSLVEFYPNFENYVREALREMPQIGAEGEKRIRIGIAKDGSGVGAALIALIAEKMVSKGI